ncbi:hypothetical protein P7D43_00845 [Enterococcus avium]|uniref:Uncharacterized protein n=1 Tax=Enterococcus avium TaxID=33945 RepID=A0AAW8RLT0_ENTAV|nr:hypothetical protein [Enterococcus avium]MDT2383531.1 hypothetical protein [Enterococcus avium]MDT2400903.1 hypothetical protein [Enterococcus avium]
MNNRHRRVEKLKRQQSKQSNDQLGITMDQVAILYKEVARALYNITKGVGTTFINISENLKEAAK